MPSLTREDAEILRLIAEAEKFQEEAGAAKAERAFKEAETRKRLAEAEAEEWRAKSARISAEANLRQEQINLSQNHYHHVFEFVSGVHEDSVAACLAQMAVWHRQDPECPMHIIMNSPGGSVIDGMHMFDDISAYSKRPWDTRDEEEFPKGTHETTITVRGYAASMAGILLQAADNRVCGPEAWIMVHEVSTGIHGKIKELEDEMDFLKGLSGNVTDIFVRRAQGKTTAVQFKKLWDRKDKWLSSREALKLGFIDRIG